MQQTISCSAWAGAAHSQPSPTRRDETKTRRDERDETRRDKTRQDETYVAHRLENKPEVAKNDRETQHRGDGAVLEKPPPVTAQRQGGARRENDTRESEYCVLEVLDAASRPAHGALRARLEPYRQGRHGHAHEHADKPEREHCVHGGGNHCAERDAVHHDRVDLVPVPAHAAPVAALAVPAARRRRPLRRARHLRRLPAPRCLRQPEPEPAGHAGGPRPRRRPPRGAALAHERRSSPQERPLALAARKPRLRRQPRPGPHAHSARARARPCGRAEGPPTNLDL